MNLNSSIIDRITARINKTTADLKKENSPSFNPKSLADVDTNVDLTELNKFNPNFSSIVDRLNTIGNKTIDTSMSQNQQNAIAGVTQAKEDVKNFKTNITQDDIAKQRSMRTPEQLQMEGRLNTGLDSLKDYMSGDSKADRTAANLALGIFDASSAAANISQAQRIASNPYMSEGAKNLASAELARTTSSQRSELSGTLALAAQERAFTAADKYSDLSLQASKYEESKFNNDMTNIGNTLDRGLNQLKTVGDLATAEGSMAINQWQTEIQAKTSDAMRSLEAAVAIGNIDQTQANLQFSKIKATVDAGFSQAQLNLEKMRGLQDNKLIDAQINEIEENRIGIWGQREANAIIDWKSSNLRDDGDYSIADDVNSIKDDPAAMAAISMSYQALMKDPSAKPTDAYILSKIKSIPTPTEASLKTVTDKMRSLKSQFVGTGVGQVTEDVWNQYESTMKTLALTGGTSKMNDDGTISMLGADGSEMFNIGGLSSSGFKESYGEELHDIVVTGYSNGLTEKDFVKQMTSDSSIYSNFTTNKEPLSKTEAISLYRSIKKEYTKPQSSPTEETNDAIDTNLKKTYAKIQDDPRFDELMEEDKISATLFKESGAKTMDEYVEWYNNKNKKSETAPITYIPTPSSTSSSLAEQDDSNYETTWNSYVAPKDEEETTTKTGISV